jgi:hypothetical protein
LVIVFIKTGEEGVETSTAFMLLLQYQAIYSILPLTAISLGFVRVSHKLLFIVLTRVGEEGVEISII